MLSGGWLQFWFISLSLLVQDTFYNTSSSGHENGAPNGSGPGSVRMSVAKSVSLASVNSPGPQFTHLYLEG